MKTKVTLAILKIVMAVLFVGLPIFMAYEIEAHAATRNTNYIYDRAGSITDNSVLMLLSEEPVGYNRRYLDEESYSVLCRIVEAEATGGTVEQKMNVASCVLNRVYSPEWPNTVKGVVFQKKQFSPIDDGRYFTVTITESTLEAVDGVLDQGLMHDCLFFCTPTCRSYKSGWFSKLKESFQDGMHAYFKGDKK